MAKRRKATGKVDKKFLYGSCLGIIGIGIVLMFYGLDKMGIITSPLFGLAYFAVGCFLVLFSTSILIKTFRLDFLKY